MNVEFFRNELNVTEDKNEDEAITLDTEDKTTEGANIQEPTANEKPGYNMEIPILQRYLIMMLYVYCHTTSI